MTDADAGASEPGHVLSVEMHGMGEPQTRESASRCFKKVDRPHPMRLDGKALLVLDLAADAYAAGNFAARRVAPKSTIRRLLTANGEQGAKAICVNAPGCGS